MSTHNIYFHGQISKIFIWVSATIRVGTRLRYISSHFSSLKTTASHQNSLTDSHDLIIIKSLNKFSRRNKKYVNN